MKCNKVEDLLPLYTRVDLDRNSQRAVRTHLESCARCRQVADEYKGVEQLIRAYEPPEFSEEFFAGIRRDVLREVGQTPAPPPTFNTWLLDLAGTVLPHRMYAAATLALVLVCLLIGLLVFRQNTIHEGNDDLALVGNGTPKAAGPDKTVAINSGSSRSEVNNGTGSVVATAGSSRHNTNRGRSRFMRTASPAITPPSQISPAVEFTSGGPAVATSRDSGASTEPSRLRIEVQTQNPNIRIIWFARDPKQSFTTN